MKQSKILLFISFFVAHSCIAPLPVVAQEKKKITLDDLYKNYTFRIKDVSAFMMMKDGEHYTERDADADKDEINVYDVKTGKKVKTLLNLKDLYWDGKAVAVSHYEFSKNEDKLLLFVDGEAVYRRSAKYKVYVYELDKKEHNALEWSEKGNSARLYLLDNDKVLHASFSPDGSLVAYVKNNNLYYAKYETGAKYQLTTDGEWNKVINGNCDWVYEEEFEFTKAFEWSKDGAYLAYYRFDESGVKEYAFAKYNGLYPQQYSYKYPKAGEANSKITIKIVDTKNNEQVSANIGTETDIYIPRIKWSEAKDELIIYRMNRLQNKLELLATQPANGKTKVIYTETNKAYIEVSDDVHFMPDGKSMIFKSETDGYDHLYYYNWATTKKICLTPGKYDVAGLLGVDDKKGVVYYTAAKATAVERKLYSVQINGENEECLTLEQGTHGITPCEGNKYFIDRYSRINKLPVVKLLNNKGEVVRLLQNNSALDSTMREYEWGQVTLTKFKGANEMLNGWMITPPHFDSNKKYPVLMYQYSGPGSQEVANRFPVGNYFWHQMLAGMGYIIVCVDGTGTGFRGEAFKKKTYLQLGKYESDDQIAVARYLGTFSYVDKNRIGIWGWSYGGFMSSTCILKGNDVFKMAIAVAPVTNWRYYDNIYTERYMRTPAENAAGYDDNSPTTMADKLKGKFLLVHGTADDNVHFQNSAMLVTALVGANKDFDTEYYPDKAHGISGGNTRRHLFRRLTQFIVDNL